MQIKRENYEKLWGKNRGIIGKQIDYKLYVMSQQKKATIELILKQRELP